MAVVRRPSDGGAAQERVSRSLLLLLGAAVLTGIAPALLLIIAQPGTRNDVLAFALMAATLGCALCTLVAPGATIRAAAPTAGAVGTGAVVVSLFYSPSGLVFLPTFVLWTVLAVKHHEQGGANAGDLIVAAFFGLGVAFALLMAAVKSR